MIYLLLPAFNEEKSIKRMFRHDNAVKLVAPDDTIAHEVTYLKKDVKNEGWTILF